MLDSQRVQIDNKFITYDVDVLPCVDMFWSLAFKITNLIKLMWVKERSSLFVVEEYFVRLCWMSLI